MGSKEDLNSSLVVCKRDGVQIDLKYFTRAVEINISECPSLNINSASLLGNLERIVVAKGNGFTIEGEDLKMWKREVSRRILSSNPLPRDISISGLSTGFNWTNGQRNIYLFGDMHIPQGVNNLCKEFNERGVETPISFFGKWLYNPTTRPRPVIFLGETPTVDVPPSKDSAPHSILGTCKWIEQSSIPGVTYIPWDVRWQIEPKLQRNIHWFEKQGDFSTLVNSCQNIGNILNDLSRKFDDTYQYMFDKLDPSSLRIFLSWRKSRIRALIKEYSNFSTDKGDLFKFQRNAFHQSTSILADSYIILSILTYDSFDIIVYGGTAHIKTIFDFLNDEKSYKLKFMNFSDNKPRNLCLQFTL